MIARLPSRAEQRLITLTLLFAVAKWRTAGDPGSTAATIRLLSRGRSERNVPRLFAAEVEAAETLTWLVEANATRNLELREARQELAEANTADTQAAPIKL